MVSKGQSGTLIKMIIIMELLIFPGIFCVNNEITKIALFTHAYCFTVCKCRTPNRTHYHSRKGPDIYSHKIGFTLVRQMLFFSNHISSKPGFRSFETTLISFLCVLDVNECATKSHSCDVNTVCDNTKGSFNCTSQTH